MTQTVTRNEKLLYTAKTHTTGGRAGQSRRSDGRLDVELSRPGTRGPAPIRSSCSPPVGPLVSKARWSWWPAR